MVHILFAAALWAASCGGSGKSAGAHDDGGTGRDGRDAESDGKGANPGQCPAPGTLVPEPPPREVALDGSVPLDRYAYALAVARCNYLSRCFALSTYAANNCVDQMASIGAWGYRACEGSLCITGTNYYLNPSDALLQAAAAGVIHYDGRQASQCIAALLAEGCASQYLLEYLPACVGVFTCPATVDGGWESNDSGADGGSVCAQFVSPNDQPYRTCSSDDDCLCVSKADQEPYCVDGICAPSRCGFTIEGCTSFATVGQPCRSNAESVINPMVAPDAMCAPGLSCHGRTADGQGGTCVVPVDVGGACTDNTNCKPGLACACGVCEIPPASGPCVNGMCEVGVAYCSSNTCHQVRPLGTSCFDDSSSCAPGLLCDSADSVCQPYK